MSEAFAPNHINTTSNRYNSATGRHRVWNNLLGPSYGGMVLESMRRRVTAIVRALIHLLDYIRERYKAVLPREITQAGIAKALKTRRSHVSTTLSSLAKKGYVEDRLGRIENGSRRRKVYFLTFKGYLRAMELRDHYLRKRIGLPQNGYVKKVRVGDLNGLLGEQYSLAEVLSCVDDSGILDIESLTGRSDTSVEDEPSMEHERDSLKKDSRAAISLYLLFEA